MTTNELHNSKEKVSLCKRKRVFAAVAQDIVKSEDEDSIADGIDICDVVEKQSDQYRETVTTCALRALGKKITNTLLEINEIREQNRERRHRELLQVLSKMVDEENSTKSEVTNSSITNKNVNIVGGYQIPPNDNIANQHIIDQNFSGVAGVTKISPSSNFFGSNLDQNLIDSKTSSNNIKLPHKSQINDTDQAHKIKSAVSVRPDTKRELQQMRSQMLELQRLKMEDRERKKRDIELQNM